MAKKKTTGKKIESLTHDESKMTNIPTAEFEEMVREDEAKPVRVEYPRKNNPDETPEIYARDPELDPQLVWRGAGAAGQGNARGGAGGGPLHGARETAGGTWEHTRPSDRGRG